MVLQEDELLRILFRSMQMCKGIERLRRIRAKKTSRVFSQHPRGEPSISFNLYQEKSIDVFPPRLCEVNYSGRISARARCSCKSL